MLQIQDGKGKSDITFLNLQRYNNSDLSKAKKEVFESEIYEIIGDELNHEDRLKMLYSMTTGIKENKE